MKKYLGFFRIRFSNTLQYRSAALAGVATQFGWGFMLILMYKAFYETGNPMPMEFSELVTYIWLQQAFLATLNFWAFEMDIIEMISSGNIAYELLRPMGLYNMWFVKCAATRLGKTVLRCMPVLIIAAALPPPLRLSPPKSIPALLLFFLTLILGMLMVISIFMLIYTATFYTVNSVGVRVVSMALAEFLSGGAIPLPFFPNGFRQVAELLPFGGVQNLPFRIYSGNIQGAELWFLVGVQIVWILLLGIAGRLWLHRAVARVVVQGG